jgi:LAO/AO transport system kinase
VVLTCAVDGRGLPELVAALDSHRAHLMAEGGWRLAARRGWAAQAELLELVKARLMQRVQARLDQDGLAVLAQEIAQKRRDPYQAADQILAAALRDTEEAPWPAM